MANLGCGVESSFFCVLFLCMLANMQQWQQQDTIPTTAPPPVPLNIYYL